MRAPKARSANRWGPGARLRAPGGGPGGGAPGSCRVLGFFRTKNHYSEAPILGLLASLVCFKNQEKAATMNLNEGYCTEKPQIKTQDNNIHLIKTYDMISYLLKGKDMHHNVKFQG